MKLVGYIFKKIIPFFIGSLVFFSLVLNLVDLFMNLTTYLQNSAKMSDVFKVMALYTPKTIWYAIPVGMLFSTSFVLSDMYANNELEALFASGVSLFKFTLPVLILSVFLSFGLYHFENRLVVWTYEKKVDLQNQLLGKSKNENNTDIIVLSQNSTIIYKAKKYTENSKKLTGVYIVFRTEEKQLRSIIYAKSAVWNEDSQLWNLNSPVQYVMENNELKVVPVSKDDLSLINEPYTIFRKSIVDVQSVSAKEAKVYIEHLKKAGLPYNEQLSEYYKKFAFPFIVFLVVFLSIGLTGKTKKNVLIVSLASCIGASVAFYVMMMVTMVLSKHGYITPFMGAWFPVFFFTVGSAILLKYSRT